MTLSDLKDQVVERLKEIGSRISENETFISLSERFYNLSPVVQKALTAGFIFLIGFLLYGIPSGYINSAKEAETTFVENRQLLRDLYRTARNPILPPERFSGPSFEDMKSQVDGMLAKTQILDTQKGTYAPVKRPLGSKVPSAIRQEGLEFEVKKLNLKQVVALSEQVSALHPNTKLAAVEINADKENSHYFNVKYTLSSLSVPIKQSPPPNNGFKKKK